MQLMRPLTCAFLNVAVVLIPVFAVAQSPSPSPLPATYITKEEVDTVNGQPGVDRQIKVVDIGPENLAVGIIHRGRTGAGAAGGAAAPAAVPAQAQPAAAAQTCGEPAAASPPAGTPSGISHDQQTEGYYIVSGEGTMVTGGRIIRGRRSAPDAAVTTELNGPSCSGFMVGPDIVTRAVKPGDIVIIPAGTPHGWSNIPEHVDYLSFRPSARVLAAGYVHPSIKK